MISHAGLGWSSHKTQYSFNYVHNSWDVLRVGKYLDLLCMITLDLTYLTPKMSVFFITNSMERKNMLPFSACLTGNFGYNRLSSEWICCALFLLHGIF